MVHEVLNLKKVLRNFIIQHINTRVSKKEKKRKRENGPLGRKLSTTFLQEDYAQRHVETTLIPLILLNLLDLMNKLAIC